MTSVLTPMLTVAEVASIVRLSEDWVREHAAELGGIRVGRGPRAQLRFDAERIEAWKERQRLASPAAPKKTPQRPGPRPAPAGVKLLPLPTGH